MRGTGPARSSRRGDSLMIRDKPWFCWPPACRGLFRLRESRNRAGLRPSKRESRENGWVAGRRGATSPGLTSRKQPECIEEQNEHDMQKAFVENPATMQQWFNDEFDRWEERLPAYLEGDRPRTRRQPEEHRANDPLFHELTQPPVPRPRGGGCPRRCEREPFARVGSHLRPIEAWPGIMVHRRTHLRHRTGPPRPGATHDPMQRLRVLRPWCRWPGRFQVVTRSVPSRSPNVS